MEHVGAFKYRRRKDAVETTKFSYDDVVTPAPAEKRVVSRKRGKKKKVNPLHDPNAKTRPSKRRVPEEPVELEPPRNVSKKTKKKSSKGGKKKKKANVAKLDAPMYPAETVSSTRLRERANASSNPNKLNALFNEALRAEATNVAKVYTGKFRYVVNAVKGVSREFLHGLEAGSAASRKRGQIAKNPRNEQLQAQKEALQQMLDAFTKEEKQWLAAKARVEGSQQKENNQPAERPIACVSTAELDQVHDSVKQSVQGIALQLDSISRSLIASRNLSDQSLQRKDLLSEKFASMAHKKHGNVDSPRKLIKNLLRGANPAVA